MELMVPLAKRENSQQSKALSAVELLALKGSHKAWPPQLASGCDGSHPPRFTFFVGLCLWHSQAMECLRERSTGIPRQRRRSASEIRIARRSTHV